MRLKRLIEKIELVQEDAMLKVLMNGTKNIVGQGTVLALESICTL
jgi:hypothetical protein